MNDSCNNDCFNCKYGIRITYYDSYSCAFDVIGDYDRPDCNYDCSNCKFSVIDSDDSYACAFDVTT